MTIRIAGIAGSLRRASFNRRLLQAALHELPGGMELAIWDHLDRVPPFNEDWEADPAPAVTALREVIAGAAGLLITTPEYNGSIPGQLKNAVDWASRPRGNAVLEGKLVGVIGASPTPYGAARAQADLRKVLTAAGAQVCKTELAVPQVFSQFAPDGRLTDPSLRGRLAQLGSELHWRATGAADEAAA
jgi:chromate reductase